MKNTQETSSISKSPSKFALEQKYQAEKNKLPVPTGWRILVLPFKGKKKTKGGILYSDEQIDTTTTCHSVWQCFGCRSSGLYGRKNSPKVHGAKWEIG